MHSTPAVIWGTRRITWAQLEQYSLFAISQFKGLGIKPGDRIAICAPLTTEYIIVLFSLWRMNVVACPINTRWPVMAINDYLSRTKACLFLTSAQMKVHLHGINGRSLNLNEVVTFDARRDFHDPHGPWEPDMEQEISVIATSGSSGHPKAAVHTWGNHYYSALGSLSTIPLQDTDRWILSLPLYHISGLAIVIRAFLAKAAIVLPHEDNLAETIVKRQVTHVSLVATQLKRLLEMPSGIEALKSLKYILLGGSAIVPGLIQKSLKEGLNIYTSYGLTEMSSQVATANANECARLLPHRELRLTGEGEILVRGQTLFKGYIQSGHIQRPMVQMQDGDWFATGDLGVLDAQGCLTVTGRKDNMFISGGENIQPEEIEKVLLLLPEIMQAVVVPKDDVEFGCRPVVFIKFSRHSLEIENLKAHCRQFLPGIKIPVAFYPWPEDVMEGMKVSRQDLIRKII